MLDSRVFRGAIAVRNLSGTIFHAGLLGLVSSLSAQYLSIPPNAALASKAKPPIPPPTTSATGVVTANKCEPIRAMPQRIECESLR